MQEILRISQLDLTQREAEQATSAATVDAEPQTTLTSLPNDVLVHIISCLDLRHQLEPREVCHRLNAALDEQHWQTQCEMGMLYSTSEKYEKTYHAKCRERVHYEKEASEELFEAADISATLREHLEGKRAEGRAADSSMRKGMTLMSVARGLMQV